MAAMSASALPPLAERLPLYLDLIRWNRPGRLAAAAVAHAVRRCGWPRAAFRGWHLVAVFTLGTILMRSAGCCINDVADRDFDRHVKRTAQRPITSGRDAGEGGAGAWAPRWRWWPSRWC